MLSILRNDQSTDNVALHIAHATRGTGTTASKVILAPSQTRDRMLFNSTLDVPTRDPLPPINNTLDVPTRNPPLSVAHRMSPQATPHQ